jgi:hypothetical protein
MKFTIFAICSPIVVIAQLCNKTPFLGVFRYTIV